LNQHACHERCVALELGEANGGGRRVAIVQGSTYEVVTVRPGAMPVREPDVAPPVAELGPDTVVEVSEARVIRVDGRVVGPAITEARDMGTAPLDGREGRR
jgi:hypothetical protein